MKYLGVLAIFCFYTLLDKKGIVSSVPCKGSNRLLDCKQGYELYYKLTDEDCYMKICRKCEEQTEHCQFGADGYKKNTCLPNCRKDPCLVSIVLRKMNNVIYFSSYTLKKHYRYISFFAQTLNCPSGKACRTRFRRKPKPEYYGKCIFNGKLIFLRVIKFSYSI